MPKSLGGRNFADVPMPSRTSRKSRAKQYEYNGYLAILNTSEVGVLELEDGDNPRSVKVSLRNAAKRMGFEVDTWDSNGQVFFRKAIGGRGKKRPPASMRDIKKAEGNPGLFGIGEEEDDEEEDDEEEEEDEEVVL